MNPIDLLESTESNRNQPCFNVILTHDNEVAAAGARFSVGRLLAAIPSNDLHHDQWSFSELGHAEFRREALELAAGCDLFVLATTEGDALPAEVSSWLNLWVQTREEKEIALVCLVGSRDGKVVSTPVQDHLQRLADAHHLAFFASSFVLPEPEGAIRIDAMVQRHSARLRFDFHPPQPEGWGINE
jgi:hypothetical protein